MNFLQHKKNEKSFTKSDYVVLSYEQLLQVNGAGGSSSSSASSSTSSSGSSGSSSSGSSSNTTNGTNNNDWTNPETWDVKYDGTHNAIRVDNTDNETCQMALTYPYTMAETLKSEYKEETGTDFNVSTGSLAAEIYLHADLYQNGIATSHTSTADCGAEDSERIVYDAYAALKGWE